MAINKSEQAAGKRKTAAQHQLVADLISQGVSCEDAHLQAGWAPAQARRIATRTHAITSAVNGGLSGVEELLALGEKATADPRFAEKVIMGRLMKNVAAGEDVGHQSAKLAGSHRAIDMFRPDQAQYVTVNVALLDQLEAGMSDYGGGGCIVKTPAVITSGRD